MTIFLLVLGIFVSYAYHDRNTITGAAIASGSCVDSDNGITSDVAGIVDYDGEKYYDSCLDKNMLNEYRCFLNFTTGVWSMEPRKIVCPLRCLNGACAK